MSAITERPELVQLNRVARAMCEVAEVASDLGSLKSAVAASGVDPDLATGCARALAQHTGSRDDVDLSQLVVIGMCVGLRLGDSGKACP